MIVKTIRNGQKEYEEKITNLKKKNLQLKGQIKLLESKVEVMERQSRRCSSFYFVLNESNFHRLDNLDWKLTRKNQIFGNKR